MHNIRMLPFRWWRYHLQHLSFMWPWLFAEGQPESIVQDIENMVRSYVEKVSWVNFVLKLNMGRNNWIKERTGLYLRLQVLTYCLNLERFSFLPLLLYDTRQSFGLNGQQTSLSSFSFNCCIEYHSIDSVYIFGLMQEVPMTFCLSLILLFKSTIQSR